MRQSAVPPRDFDTQPALPTMPSARSDRPRRPGGLLEHRAQARPAVLSSGAQSAGGQAETLGQGPFSLRYGCGPTRPAPDCCNGYWSLGKEWYCAASRTRWARNRALAGLSPNKCFAGGRHELRRRWMFQDCCCGPNWHAWPAAPARSLHGGRGVDHRRGPKRQVSSPWRPLWPPVQRLPDAAARTAPGLR